MGEKKRKNRRRQGYIHKSPAICVVVYDLDGTPVSDEVAAKVVDAVFEVTQRERLAISYTRT